MLAQNNPFPPLTWHWIAIFPRKRNLNSQTIIYYPLLRVPPPPHLNATTLHLKYRRTHLIFIDTTIVGHKNGEFDCWNWNFEKAYSRIIVSNPFIIIVSRGTGPAAALVVDLDGWCAGRHIVPRDEWDWDVCQVISFFTRQCNRRAGAVTQRYKAIFSSSPPAHSFWNRRDPRTFTGPSESHRTTTDATTMCLVVRISYDGGSDSGYIWRSPEPQPPQPIYSLVIAYVRIRSSWWTTKEEDDR